MLILPSGSVFFRLSGISFSKVRLALAMGNRMSASHDGSCRFLLQEASRTVKPKRVTQICFVFNNTE